MVNSWVLLAGNLKRESKKRLLIFSDIVGIWLSLTFAYFVQSQSFAFLLSTDFWILAGIISVANTQILGYFGIYSRLTRFITGRILIPVTGSTLMLCCLIMVLSCVLSLNFLMSTTIIFALISIVTLASIRFLTREIFRKTEKSAREPVIIFGAGSAGLQLQNSLYHGDQYAPVAFVDDNPALQNLEVGGLRVHSASELAQICHQTGATLILLAATTIKSTRLQELLAEASSANMSIRRIPSLADLISGAAEISQLRPVSADELLGRDPVDPDANLMASKVNDRTVLVTGAGGSIGSELCRQILRLNPKNLIILDHSELALYEIEIELKESISHKDNHGNVIPILASVLHKEVIDHIFNDYSVDTVFHAAAYKHVPLIEENVISGIENNCFGTLCMAEAAVANNIESFILVSTDKAVRPTNIMGATKRLSELICQALADDPRTDTIFSMVRFGNVLGSSGSVIPRFAKQIAHGGPVTVTHASVTRYFMTISEAAQLVIQASSLAKQGGEVFVLDMGSPVKIFDLAVNMVRLSGLIPVYESSSPSSGEIKIKITGLRAGEKLFEELLIGNNPIPTAHPRIMMASEVKIPLRELMETLYDLRRHCNRRDLAKVMEILTELPLELTRTGEPCS